MQHLTHSRIAAALAAATQSEGERPWHLLLTKPPMTYADTRRWIFLERNPSSREFAGVDDATCRAEASRARIINDLARRDAYMAALSASEQMMSTTPVLPTSTGVDMAAWSDGPTIRWGFHGDRTAVVAFATHFGVPVTERPHNDEGTTTYVSANGVIDGAQFEAYALVDATTEQVAA